MDTEVDGGQEATTVLVMDDGSVELHAPAVHSSGEAAAPANWGENLAERMEDGALALLGQEIADGVEADRSSRTKFLSQLSAGLDLLGLEIENPAQGKATSTGMLSRVWHPVMTEAVVRAQSSAMAELFPAEGPAKVLTRSGDTAASDALAEALERDLNWYLTTGAPEFRPDLDRGVFGLFFSGNLFRKVYEHPLRRRPCVESVATEDLIVSQDAADLETATRVTHRGMYSQALLQRMQWQGWWRDVSLPLPSPMEDRVARKESQIIGVRADSLRPQDLAHEIWECTTDLDFADVGLPTRGIPNGLMVPATVTVDKDSRTVLAIRRAWRYGDGQFRRRQQFVHYGMVPAFHFLCLGYVHLLGNHAKTLTAIWRILCDAGMFSNFPGGIRAKGVRTQTNEINPAPGEFTEADVGAFDDIRKAIMPLPYQGPSPVFIQLAEIIAQDAQRLGGAVEFDVGEGRANVPVGTMLAQVEQATQMTAAVHKRLHAAQARELKLLMECFADNPDALWKLNPNPARQWQTAAEFESLDLVPASDPNVPAQIHRVMLAQAMMMAAQQNPLIYDQVEAHKRAWAMLGVNDVDTLLHPPAPPPMPPAPPPPPPDPMAAVRQQEVQIKQQQVATQAQENQRKAAGEAVEAQQRGAEMQADAAMRRAELASKERIAAMQEQTERVRLGVEEARAHRQAASDAQTAALDRQHDVGMATLGHMHQQQQAPVAPQRGVQ